MQRNTMSKLMQVGINALGRMFFLNSSVILKWLETEHETHEQSHIQNYQAALMEKHFSICCVSSQLQYCICVRIFKLNCSVNLWLAQKFAASIFVSKKASDTANRSQTHTEQSKTRTRRMPGSICKQLN